MNAYTHRQVKLIKQAQQQYHDSFFCRLFDYINQPELTDKTLHSFLAKSIDGERRKEKLS